MSYRAGDSFISLAQGPPVLPDPGTNNIWYSDRTTDSAIVFVHGIFSDSRSCWLNEGPPSTYWPDLVARDSRFDRYSLYLGGYYTALDAGAFKMQHCADHLYRALARSERPSAESVLQRSTLIFVCHSTGGIVVRYLLESRAEEFKTKTVGLVLIASPSYGSAWATKLSWLSQFYNAELARQLEWGNNSLDDLDERFHRLIGNGIIPHLLGVEAYENHFIFHHRLLPDRLVIVDKQSAGRYFAPAHLLPRTDHFTSVKPDSPRHPAHELLVDFCAELHQYQRQHTLGVNAAARRAVSLGAQPGSSAQVSSDTSSPSRQAAANTPPGPKIVTIFFSSPSDVSVEKSKLIAIVDEMNPSFARHSIILRAWAFERDANPGVAFPGGSVQTVIDVQLPRNSEGSLTYDLFVGIMDGRIGTPLKDAPSGTVHEFFEAKKSFEASGKPHVLFYFRTRGSTDGAIELPSEGVSRFRSTYPGLFASYSSVEDLEGQFRRHLLTELLDLLQPNTSHLGGYTADDEESWGKILAAYTTAWQRYPATYLDNSPTRVSRILKQLNRLLGFERQLQFRERVALIGALFSRLLNEEDRAAFESSVDGNLGAAPEIRNVVLRMLDPSQLAVRPLGAARLDLVAALALIGLKLDLVRSAIAAGQGPPASTALAEDWLAFLTDEIACDRGVVRFHLIAPSAAWDEPLRCATAVALESMWQRTRTVFTRHGLSFAVAKSQVEVGVDVGDIAPAALESIKEHARDAIKSLPVLPHLGQSKLPLLDALLPLPASRVRASVIFRAPRPGPVRLLVNGAVVAEEAELGAVYYTPPLGQVVTCLLECDEAGEFVPVIQSSLQGLTPAEAGVLEADGASKSILWSLHLWNDILEQLWPRVSGVNPSRENLAAAYHVLRNAYEGLGGSTGALLERRDVYWDAMEIVRKRLAFGDF